MDYETLDKLQSMKVDESTWTARKLIKRFHADTTYRRVREATGAPVLGLVGRVHSFEAAEAVFEVEGLSNKNVYENVVVDFVPTVRFQGSDSIRNDPYRNNKMGFHYNVSERNQHGLSFAHEIQGTRFRFSDVRAVIDFDWLPDDDRFNPEFRRFEELVLIYAHGFGDDVDWFREEHGRGAFHHPEDIPPVSRMGPLMLAAYNPAQEAEAFERPAPAKKHVVKREEVPDELLDVPRQSYGVLGQQQSVQQSLNHPWIDSLRESASSFRERLRRASRGHDHGEY